MKIEHNVDLSKKRVNIYPPIGDQLDLIYKGFVEEMESGKTLSPSHLQWVKMIKEIKDKYPKSS